MLKLLYHCIKTILFAIIILVLGNWLKWDGKTLSEQVKEQMTHPNYVNYFKRFQQKSSDLFNDLHHTAPHNTHETRTPARSAYEEISPSEKQKLRALIQELNASKKPE